MASGSGKSLSFSNSTPHYCNTPTRGKRRMNELAVKMIVTVINIINSDKKKRINSLRELESGDLLVSLARIITDDETRVLLDEVMKNDINKKFDIVAAVIVNNLGIKEGIDYNAAKQADEFELAKIAFILIIYGVQNEIKDIFDACESLDTNQYSLIDIFYNLLQRDKHRSLPTEVKLYEEFLCLTTKNQKSLGKLFL